MEYFLESLTEKLTEKKISMKKIKEICFKTGTRISEFMIDFDPLRSGYMTVQQLRRTLELTRIKLTDQEFKEVVDRYYDPVKKLVNHAKFSKDVNTVFVVENMEKDPNLHLTEKKEEFRKKLSQINDPDELQFFKSIIVKILHESKLKGITVTRAYEDFDLHHIGTVFIFLFLTKKITENQFIRSWPFSCCSTKEINYLITRYKVKNTGSSGVFRDSTVNYLQFRDDLALAKEKKLVAPIDYQKQLLLDDECYKSYFDKYEKKTIEDVEKKLYTLIYKNRINLKDCFTDFDKLRKGVVTRNVFYRIIGSVKFPKKTFFETEMKLLSEKYLEIAPDKVELFKYKDFFQQLEKLFSPASLEKNPEKTHNDPVLNDKDLPKLTEEEENTIIQLLKKIRERVNSRRILLINIFKDMNKTDVGVRSNYITGSRFIRCLDNLGLKFSKEDYECLVRKYDQKKDGFVNYNKFCDHVAFGEKYLYFKKSVGIFN